MSCCNWLKGTITAPFRNSFCYYRERKGIVNKVVIDNTNVLVWTSDRLEEVCDAMFACMFSGGLIGGDNLVWFWRDPDLHHADGTCKVLMVVSKPIDGLNFRRLAVALNIGETAHYWLQHIKQRRNDCLLVWHENWKPYTFATIVMDATFQSGFVWN